ncbi:molybdopterin cofactor-binding domain-containing protein [Rubellimicrobium arenae]|uniref:molybdopterin cofactor-binding domain-containing protein n=1 Tax=Rubellimicrobium arenae TaxID=2817372 RepID=UPI001B312242|nr:molybdopterin cofactor-binding domain-containing protein [Rubellimicrobium arenae]
MRVVQPSCLDGALSLLDEPGAKAIAGGTALQLDWARGEPRPDLLVNLAPLLPSEIIHRGDKVEIGAGCTLEALRLAGLPLLSRAAADVAAPGVRRLGTVGGTIGWGAGDLLPALLVLEASVVTTSGVAMLRDWIVQPNGLLLSVQVPVPPPAARLVWRKVGLRAAFTPSIIAVAGAMTCEDGKVSVLSLAVGGGAVPPSRLEDAEADLIGRSPDIGTFEGAISTALPAVDCPFRSAAYRRRVAARALTWGLLAPAGDGRRLEPPRRAPGNSSALSRENEGDRWHIRPDMPGKVAGTWPYLTDLRRPGMLVGRILRAAHPHARIRGIDVSAAEACPGVRAVVTAQDVPGLNAFGIVLQDQPALCADKVRYLGDAVAAVAALDDATAERALSLIRVDYDPLPVVEDPEAALLPDSAKVHATGNLVTELGLVRGEPDMGFASAAHVVEDIYETPRQMHGFLETEGGYAEVQPDGTLLVAVGGQHGARDRLQLSRILGWPEQRIRVVTSPTGGAFGGKDELTVQPALALLALKSRAPVRLQLSRAESVLAGTKRSPMRIRMRTACDAEGHLLAQEVDVVADAGAYASLSPGVLETALEHAAGPYVVPNLRTRGRLVYTNNGTCGAFRGFGANQMTFAVECQIDRLAAACGLDPIEMRRRNLRSPGMPGALGQVVAPSERLREMLDTAAASPLWAPLSGQGEWLGGTGMALMWQGNGLGTLPHDEGAGELRLSPDGAIEVLCGLDEMGQGLMASLTSVVADRLGCARGDVRPVIGDTARTPDSGSTTASRGGFVVWKIAEAAGPTFASKVLALSARLTGISDDKLRIVPGGVGEIGQNSPSPLLSFAELARVAGPLVTTVRFPFPKADYTKGNARFIFASAAILARVAVSRVTGQIRVADLHLHTAAGPVIDLASYLGQMEGGAVQGLGFTLTEDVRMAQGRPLTPNLDTYAMPGIRDIPDRLVVTALEDLDPGDPYGPRGAGELGIGAVTPAVCNAVAQAVGGSPAVMPIRPETILEWLDR